ncbi:MAG: S46 family peptidase [Bacteroidota bacterium]
MPRLLFFAGLLVLAGCTTTEPVVQPAPAPVVQTDTVFIEVPTAVAPGEDLSDVEAGRFDNGKMWTFDNPPIDYFQEAYGLEPDAAWFEKARTAALRIPGCSASFVSPNGLVMTNHHCAREHITAVSQDGENLLDNGFYAESLDQERRIEDYYADQLISITDVTEEVEAAAEGADDPAGARDAAIDAITERMLTEAGGEDAGFEVEVISLYNGGQYSAYLFRRYDDVRLVAAPELQIGYYGGDPDNFTYPRYNLDYTFYRVYDENGQPLKPAANFSFTTAGVSDGDAVFVIGNPGSTSRLQTVAQLEFRRDFEEPFLLNLLETRVAAMEQVAEAEPEMAEEIDLINTVFSLKNAIKAYTGRLEGLENPVLMARRQDTESDLRERVAADTALSARYAGVFERIEELQGVKADYIDELGSYTLNPGSSLYSSTLVRGTFGYLYALQRQFGAPEESLAGLKETLMTLDVNPPALEEALITARFNDLILYLGEDHPTVQAALGGQTPADAAAALVANTAVLDSTAFAEMLPAFMESDDPARAIGEVMGQGIITLQQGLSTAQAEEGELERQIARARFDVYGTSFPPDATFSLRIADGLVKPYEYNGTTAPEVTTFFGLYDRFHSHGQAFPWSLPERWQTPPASLDLSTPINFVSTNDIIGGNSGSPVVNGNLEVVGLAFDGNIESLPGEFIFTEETARTVSVDVRGILASLDHVYDADRIVQELLSGRLVESEADADEQMGM